MKLVTSYCLGAALVFLASACGDDGRTRGDAGDTGITLMDTGVGGDTSTTDTGGRPDSGTVGDGGSCPPVVVPAPTGNVCSAMSLTCAMACPTGDGPCIQGCFATEPPECVSCIIQDLNSCATMNGCDQEFGDGACCFEANCATAADAEVCIAAMCATEDTAYNSCLQGAAMLPACGGAGAICFMAM